MGWDISAAIAGGIARGAEEAAAAAAAAQAAAKDPGDQGNQDPGDGNPQDPEQPEEAPMPTEETEPEQLPMPQEEKPSSGSPTHGPAISSPRSAGNPTLGPAAGGSPGLGTTTDTRPRGRPGVRYGRTSAPRCQCDQHDGRGTDSRGKWPASRPDPRRASKPPRTPGRARGVLLTWPQAAAPGPGASGPGAPHRGHAR